MHSIAARLEEAQAFLIENPHESKACASRLFKIPYTTLVSAIARDADENRPTIIKRGGQNRILEAHQVEALHGFIRSLLLYDIQFIKLVVFNAIKHLKRSQNPDSDGSTSRWFRAWWQSAKLHTIRIKPLAVIRYSAAQVEDVRRWFHEYRLVLKELKIKNKRNILNFDEAGFRIGCMKGHDIIVPEDVKEFYAISPENRRSLTIFEMINAAGEQPPPPFLVIQGHEMMVNWFSTNLPDGTRILPSPNGFTSDKIAQVFLQHFIDNSDAGLNSEWKLMLMDNHGSHVTFEFIKLANEHRIRPFPFIPHLTHCMQSLDVGVFQPYKHWHDVAIQDAIAEFNIEYSMTRFCHDLAKIRKNTFKKSTIRSAFAKFGMWPLNANRCIDQLRKFSRKKDLEVKKIGISSGFFPSLPLPLPQLRVQPNTLEDVERGLFEWLPKIPNHTQWSDPIREEELNDFVNSTQKIVAEANFKDYELSLHHKRRHDELTQKATCRKRLRVTFFTDGDLGLIKEDAMRMLVDKQRKETEAEKKKEHNQFMRIWRMERDSIHAKSVLARKSEKDRIKRIKDLTKRGLVISIDDFTVIEDLEAIWKATDVT